LDSVFKKFFVYIVNKVENEVYFNEDNLNKENQENLNGNQQDRRESLMSLNGKTVDELHNRPNAWSVFWDSEKAGLSNVDMDILNFMVNQITKNFPLGLAHVYIYELPWILQAILKLVQSWIPPYYINSIVLVKKSDLSEKRSPIDAKNLPKYLDGECERKTTTVPKNCLTADQIGELNGISPSNVKKLQRHIDSHCKIKE